MSLDGKGREYKDSCLGFLDLKERQAREIGSGRCSRGWGSASRIGCAFWLWWERVGHNGVRMGEVFLGALGVKERWVGVSVADNAWSVDRLFVTSSIVTLL